LTRPIVTVSARGQVTLPNRLRDRLAISSGSALMADESDGALATGLKEVSAPLTCA